MKPNKLATLISYASLATSVYAQAFQDVKETLDLVDNKPVKFNPDNLNRNHKIIPKNHKLFIIEGIEIYALNYKNALKKYNKQNKISNILKHWED